MDLLIALVTTLAALPLYVLGAVITVAILIVDLVADRRRPAAQRVTASTLIQQAGLAWVMISALLLLLPVAVLIGVFVAELVREAAMDPRATLVLVAAITVGVVVGRRRGVGLGMFAMWLTAMALYFLPWVTGWA